MIPFFPYCHLKNTFPSFVLTLGKMLASSWILKDISYFMQKFHLFKIWLLPWCDMVFQQPCVEMPALTSYRLNLCKGWEMYIFWNCIIFSPPFLAVLVLIVSELFAHVLCKDLLIHFQYYSIKNEKLCHVFIEINLTLSALDVYWRPI